MTQEDVTLSMMPATTGGGSEVAVVMGAAAAVQGFCWCLSTVLFAVYGIKG